MLSVKKLCLDSGIRVKRHELEYGIFQGMKPADNVPASASHNADEGLTLRSMPTHAIYASIVKSNRCKWLIHLTQNGKAVDVGTL